MVSEIAPLIDKRIAPDVVGANQISETPKPTIETLLFSEPADPRRENLSKEERIRLHYAQTLAVGELDDLTPRYRSSEHNPDNKDADVLVADPMSDPEVGRLASIIKAATKKG